jgi:hypothetical protein
MKVGIMQPYLLPYVGYFQLINAVDKFVVYDNIEYTKKGWINRNRYLLNGNDAYFTLPLKKDSDYLDVRERRISDNYDSKDLINKIKSAYWKAPYFQQTFPLFQSIVENSEKNLFEFIYQSILKIVGYLDIPTEIIISSSLGIDHTLKGQDKVLSICKELNADQYINAIGGVHLYSKENFLENGIELSFIKTKPMEYKQFENDFVPWLSMIDLLMFNDGEAVKCMLQEYELV